MVRVYISITKGGVEGGGGGGHVYFFRLPTRAPKKDISANFRAGKTPRPKTLPSISFSSFNFFSHVKKFWPPGQIGRTKFNLTNCWQWYMKFYIFSLILFCIVIFIHSYVIYIFIIIRKKCRISFDIIYFVLFILYTEISMKHSFSFSASLCACNIT